MKIIVKELRNLKNPVHLSKVIYNNFLYISYNPILQHNLTEIIRLLSGNNFMGLICYDKDKLVAYLIGEFKHLQDGRYVYYISYLYTAKRYRGKKIASQIINILIIKCKNIGIKYIMLTCDTLDKKVVKFYEKRNFVRDPIYSSGQRHDVYILYL